MKFRKELPQKVGRLTIIGERPEDNIKILCRCDCGKEKMITIAHLLKRTIKSCGCIRSEKTIARKTKHGFGGGKIKRSKEYESWAAMRKRCNNPNDKAYKNYGGRGIIICNSWEDFNNFITDMGPRPDGKSLDRVNNDGNYEPSNCRWATRLEQNRNKRNVKARSSDKLYVLEPESALSVRI